MLLLLHIGVGAELYFASSGLYPRYVELYIGGENALSEVTTGTLIAFHFRLMRFTYNRNV